MPTNAAGWYKAYCAAYAGKVEAQPIAITEVFDTDLSLDNISDDFTRYLYDARKGRVTVPFDTSQELRGICLSGDERVRQRTLSFHRQRGRELISIKSPLDARGYYRPNGSKNVNVTAPPKVAVTKMAPTTPVTTNSPTPNQLKYQRELAAYQARLAEIEQVKSETAAALARNKIAAQQVIDQHLQEMDVNRQQVAAADRAKRKYEQELAAHQAQVDQQRTKQDREALADWPEAIAVCELNPQNPQSKFGNWRCEGPLQYTYAKLGNGGQSDIKAMASVSGACGGKVESVRDLAMVGGYRVFGCSFGLNPNPAKRLATDKAPKFGLTYVPGRATYRCPTYVSYCRTR